MQSEANKACLLCSALLAGLAEAWSVEQSISHGRSIPIIPLELHLCNKSDSRCSFLLLGTAQRISLSYLFGIQKPEVASYFWVILPLLSVRRRGKLLLRGATANAVPHGVSSEEHRESSSSYSLGHGWENFCPCSSPYPASGFHTVKEPGCAPGY